MLSYPIAAVPFPRSIGSVLKTPQQRSGACQREPALVLHRLGATPNDLGRRHRSRGENVASKKIPTQGRPGIGGFGVAHRNYVATECFIKRPLPAVASDTDVRVR